MRFLSVLSATLMFSTALIVVGCDRGQPEVHGDPEASAEKPHWTYEGEYGPDHWGSIPGCETCGTGRSQSPIDLTGAVESSGAPLVFNYGESHVNLVNNGHTIQQNYDPGSSVRLGEKDFNLVQFHFHSMSEHTVDGFHYPLEAHFVHAAEDGELVVVGVFFEEGAENAFLASFWEHLPRTAGATFEDERKFISASSAFPVGKRANAVELPPDAGEGARIGAAVGGLSGALIGDLFGEGLFNYRGSLTTPPCTEGVNWFVFRQPVEASPAQLAQFRKIYSNNFRPVQPLNGREIRLFKP